MPPRPCARSGERRAKAVRDWLIAQHYMDAASSKIRGYGKARPAAPNTNADGSDNPAARQTNRRVEIAIDTCTDAGQDTNPSTRARP